ncbi:DUF1127 domain-containing protein [Bradyrhizobium sp.]|uniref:DUF1127 domain-containing protein n=1 Tax=Bradyrhizobium sp. TaxID=376 RepID=UPI0040383B13
MSNVCAEGRRLRRRPFPVSLLAIARSILILIAAWRERRRVRRQLAAMSDRELHDIGVCRAEVADEIGRPFWREMKGRSS